MAHPADLLNFILQSVFYAGVQSTIPGATIKTPAMSVESAIELIEDMLIGPTDTSHVTRFEVIDHYHEQAVARAFTIWKPDLKVQLSFQDDDRTLKIFLLRTQQPVCSNCGKEMKRQTDPVTKKLSLYLWHCDCMPDNVDLAILGGQRGIVEKETN